MLQQEFCVNSHISSGQMCQKLHFSDYQIAGRINMQRIRKPPSMLNGMEVLIGSNKAMKHKFLQV